MYKTLVFMKRKPGLSRDQFIRYYEANHAPLALEALPNLIRYSRSYTAPVEGDPQDPPYDVVTELSWASEAEFLKAMVLLEEPTIARKIAEDEEFLFDRSATRYVRVDEYTSNLGAT